MGFLMTWLNYSHMKKYLIVPIWRWWCKDVFIPIGQNALNDDKVQQHLSGKIAVVGDYRKQLQILAEDYYNTAKEVTEKEDICNLKIEVAQPQAKIETKEWMVYKLVAE